MNYVKLYRGFKDSFVVGQFHNRYLDIPRNPLHTPPLIHQKADDWFYKQFGYRFRSQALFCYGSIRPAMDYGVVGIVEPIGEHQLCWSPNIVDLYGAYMTAPDECTIEELLNAGEYQMFTLVNAEVVEKALRSEHEIMLWCKEYRVSR